MAAYRVEIRAIARKAIEALPRPAQRRVVAAIETLAETPRPAGCKKLRTPAGVDLYRLRVGEYRVVYSVEDQMLVVLVVRVAHRREVYR
ncbi:type II toxin-antitoxin system RelE/ParE family toxin [bacterium]|nr:type II toxin-antitoxin system RelE/ParE family toxin [bacterium]